MLRNSLGSARRELVPEVDRATWKREIDALECAGARPEELTPAELGLLADAIYGFRS